jgi:hypothetical protein
MSPPAVSLSPPPEAGAHRRDEIALAFDADEAFELTGETRSVTVFDERRRAHAGEGAGALREVPPRGEQRIEDFGDDRLVEQPQFHGERAAAHGRAVARTECAARRFPQAERRDLLAVCLRIDAEAVRYGEPRPAENRLVGRLRSEAAGIARFDGEKRNDEC